MTFCNLGVLFLLGLWTHSSLSFAQDDYLEAKANLDTQKMINLQEFVSTVKAITVNLLNAQKKIDELESKSDSQLAENEAKSTFKDRIREGKESVEKTAFQQYQNAYTKALTFDRFPPFYYDKCTFCNPNPLWSLGRLDGLPLEKNAFANCKTKLCFIKIARDYSDSLDEFSSNHSKPLIVGNFDIPAPKSLELNMMKRRIKRYAKHL